MKGVGNLKSDFKNDVTWNRVGRLGSKGARALPSASLRYALDKFPIIGWLPRYNWRWILNDVIAGLTVGLMLIPQSLAYAKIATIPVQYGLMSSWIPPAFGAIMGTSKDLSVGPTSLIGLLTSEVVEELENEYTPSEIASAVALMAGVYSMAIGFLKLGFLLEFISLPILNGFITAVAIVIMLGQVGSLLGLPALGDGAANQIHDIFAFLPQATGLACAIGFAGIVYLTILDQAHKRVSKHKIVWLLSITRAFTCLALFTGISYAVNGKYGTKAADYKFPVVQVKAEGLEAPRMPPAHLISQVATRSVALFIGAAVEHTAIARAFGVRNGYVTDQSQELSYLGVTNFVNSFFHAMGVGGAMSRTAVNSACNVRSPLSGFVTSAVVLVSIYKLVGVLYWIPKATLAAIIITAVWPLMSPPSLFYGYWKASLVDFISAMLALWVSLFVNTSIGIASAVGFNVVYIVLRQVFTRVRSVSGNSNDVVDLYRNDTVQTTMSRADTITSATNQPDARVFYLNDSVFFGNSYSVRTSILDAIQTHHNPTYSSSSATEKKRNWSVVGEKRIARLRKEAAARDGGRYSSQLNLPPIGLVVIDFGRANHIDVTAVTHLKNLHKELKTYAGDTLEIRFCNMSDYVQQRFERMGWRIIGDGMEVPIDEAKAGDVGPTRLYRDVASALAAPRRHSMQVNIEDLKRLNSGYTRASFEEKERA